MVRQGLASILATLSLVIIVMGLDYLESRGGDGQGLFVRWWGGDGILEAMGAPWGGGWAAVPKYCCFQNTAVPKYRCFQNTAVPKYRCFQNTAVSKIPLFPKYRCSKIPLFPKSGGWSLFVRPWGGDGFLEEFVHSWGGDGWSLFVS